MNIVDFTLRAVAQRRLNKLERYINGPIELQAEQLKWLLQRAQNTVYGVQYQFSKIQTKEQFKEQVPLLNYDKLCPFIERGLSGEDNLLWSTHVSWYAKSSGTTEKRSKFLPVSREMITYSHFRGGRDSIAFAYNNFPDTHAFCGKTLALGGALCDSGLSKIHTGDLSAIMLANTPLWVNRLKVPSKDVMLMPDWDKKIDMICRTALMSDVRCLAGVPSWFLTLIQRLLIYTGAKDLTEVWPNIELFIHGGIGFEPYRELYKQLIPTEKMKYLETYNASEGFFGIQSNPIDTSLMLMLDYKTYYEFIPLSECDKENPKVLTLSEVELNEHYELVISTCAGLWRYRMGDTIRFTSLSPYKFKITGRTKLYINAFGEELMIDNANKAVSEVSTLLNCRVFDYTVAPIFMEQAKKGAHEWVVEFVVPPADVERFTTELDEALRRVNSDYDAKRNSSLKMLKLHVAPMGFFESWMRDNGKLGGQHKVPRLKNDRTIMEDILERLKIKCEYEK